MESVTFQRSRQFINTYLSDLFSYFAYSVLSTGKVDVFYLNQASNWGSTLAKVSAVGVHEAFRCLLPYPLVAPTLLG